MHICFILSVLATRVKSFRARINYIACIPLRVTNPFPPHAESSIMPANDSSTTDQTLERLDVLVAFLMAVEEGRVILLRKDEATCPVCGYQFDSPFAKHKS